MLLEQDYVVKAKEIIAKVQALQLEKVKTWKDAIRIIPEVIKAVEVEAWTSSEYEKKKLAVAIANELVDIPYVPESAEGALFGAMIDFAVDLANQLFGQNWIEKGNAVSSPMDPTKLVPMSAWDQIAVIVVFAFLLAGLGWVLVKVFTKAIADINAHYATLLEKTNTQWQQYFDARSETSNLINKQVVTQLSDLTKAVTDLTIKFNSHDQWERQLQDQAEIPTIVRKKRGA